jgi:hypothetical protein
MRAIPGPKNSRIRHIYHKRRYTQATFGIRHIYHKRRYTQATFGTVFLGWKSMWPSGRIYWFDCVGGI